jgi:hypothetical protein
MQIGGDKMAGDTDKQFRPQLRRILQQLADHQQRDTEFLTLLYQLQDLLQRELSRQQREPPTMTNHRFKLSKATLDNRARVTRELTEEIRLLRKYLTEELGFDLTKMPITPSLMDDPDD